LRVAVFTNQFPGHTSAFFARDVRGLIEAGIDVEVFPFYSLEPALWSAVPGLLNERILPRQKVHHVSVREAVRAPQGDEWRRLPAVLKEALTIACAGLRFGPEASAKSAYVAIKAWAWARQFPAGSFDHVLSYWGNYSATAAYLFHRLTDPEIPFSMFVHARVDLYQKQTYLAEKMLYADNVFLVCEYNRGYVKDRYAAAWPRLAEKIRVHHLGLDLAEFAFSPGERPACRIITVGGLERLKGIHCLLHALDKLAKRGIRPEVDVIGGGEEANALERLAARLGLAGQVRFVGWLPPDEVRRAMQTTTILVHPSIRPDAMPTVLKEAIAVGTPVIASDLAGIPEILDGGLCGTLVPAGDIVGLADAIQQLLGDPELRARYAAHGRAHAERCFDLWSNGRLLAERLRTSKRGASTAGAAAHAVPRARVEA
jgi:colanic acid/amylovoran biosynthesis glycosyltransferase